jgi:hypothetical protein
MRVIVHVKGQASPIINAMMWSHVTPLLSTDAPCIFQSERGQNIACIW